MMCHLENVFGEMRNYVLPVRDLGRGFEIHMQRPKPLHRVICDGENAFNLGVPSHVAKLYIPLDRESRERHYSQESTSHAKRISKISRVGEFLVRKEGFEPSHLTAPPPQDGASASS